MKVLDVLKYFKQKSTWLVLGIYFGYLSTWSTVLDPNPAACSDFYYLLNVIWSPRVFKGFKNMKLIKKVFENKINKDINHITCATIYIDIIIIIFRSF